MRLIQLSVLGVLISVITIHQSFADILVYHCKMKGGHFLYTDQPCKNDEKETSRKIIKNLVLNHSVAPKPIKEDPVKNKHRFDDTNTSYLSQRRRIYEHPRQLYYPQQIIVAPDPQNTYPYNYTTQPLFNPPLSFKPPLTLQTPLR
jgi:hypothetical protein